MRSANAPVRRPKPPPHHPSHADPADGPGNPACPIGPSAPYQFATLVPRPDYSKLATLDAAQETAGIA